MLCLDSGKIPSYGRRRSCQKSRYSVPPPWFVSIVRGKMYIYTAKSGGKSSFFFFSSYITPPAYLHSLSVEPCPDTQALRVLNDIGADDSRPVRSPPVEALAQRPLAASVLDLPVAVGDVVAHGIAEDVVQGLILGHLLAALADHDDELALVIQALALLGNGRDGDGVAVGGQRGDRLVEQDGELGLRHARLVGVQGVVEAEAAHRPDVG